MMMSFEESRTLRKFIWVVMLAAGCLLALSGYQHGLPYIDYGDEMTMWTRGRATIDPTWDMFQPEYPPGMVWFSALVQQIQIAQGDPFINPAGATAVGRLTSVIAYTAALGLIMLLTWRLIESLLSERLALLAMVSAGLFWMLLPLAVLHARYAMPDCWMTALFLASLVCGIEGWIRRSPRWIWLSFGFGILATIFKWQAAVILMVAGLMFLRFYLERQPMLRHLIIYLLVSAGFSYWVVFIRRALQGGLYMPGTSTAFPTPLTVVDNLLFNLTGIGPWPIFGLLALVGLVLTAPRVTRSLNVAWGEGLINMPDLYGDRALWLLPLLILALNTVLSVNGSRLFERHYLPGLALLAVLAGVGLALSLQFITRLSGPLLRWALGAGVILAAVVPLADMGRQVYDLTRDHLRPDRRVFFAEWASQTAVDGVMMVTDRNLANALDPLYGYRGRKIETPEWGAFIGLDDLTDEKMIEQNARYIVSHAAVPPTNIHTRLTPLISYGDNPNLRGEPWTVFYVGDLPILPPEQWGTFGDEIQLRGFSFSKTTVCPGEAVEMRLLWTSIRPPARYYSYFLHLANESSGELSAPINGQPPIGDHRPTLSWTVPGELLVPAPQSWLVPVNIPAGVYALWLGLFDSINGERLYQPDGKHYSVLTELKVKNCASDGG